MIAELFETLKLNILSHKKNTRSYLEKIRKKSNKRRRGKSVVGLLNIKY